MVLSWPMRQQPSGGYIDARRDVFPRASATWIEHESVGTMTDSTELVSLIQKEILNIDKDQAVTEMATLDQVVGESIEQPRLTMYLLVTFALIALTPAAIGIYGVMAYAVAQRTREIGIRIALGAQDIDVVKLVVRSGMSLALVGVAIGLAGALALTRLLASLVFEIAATDVTTFALVSLSRTPILPETTSANTGWKTK
jgi:putative ABC transport system permease protein